MIRDVKSFPLITSLKYLEKERQLKLFMLLVCAGLSLHQFYYNTKKLSSEILNTKELNFFNFKKPPKNHKNATPNKKHAYFMYFYMLHICTQMLFDCSKLTSDKISENIYTHVSSV